MRCLLLITFLILSPTLIIAQRGVQVIVKPDRMVKYKDAYYENDLNGISNLLSDIRMNEPTLYLTMLPKLQKLKRDRNTAITVLIGGTVVSTLIISPALFSGSADGVVGKIVSGTLVFTGATAVALIKMPKQQDLLNFYNQFNLKTGDEKLHFTVNPMFGFVGGLTGGLGLAVRF